MSELDTKLAKIYQLLEQHHLDALYLQRVSSFAWATCGASSYINSATTTGEGSLLITPQARYLITSNIEAPRFEKEEKLKEQGWQFEVFPWYQGSDALARLTGKMKVGADVCLDGMTDLSAEVTLLRMNLLPEEQERFKALGKLSAEAMDAAVRAARPGMTEFEIAARLAEETLCRGALPIVNLIATDERIYNFRHPLPVNKKMEKYAMLVLCARQNGLVTSITRLIHYGPLPAELKKKEEAVAAVDAAMMTATRPGRTLAQVFADTQQAYTQVGYPDQWQYHHQGGPAGYEPREIVATPSTNAGIAAGQVYAWNPSITGVKSEDSVLITATGFEVITEIPNWPMLEVTSNGQTVRRPRILEV